MEPRASIHSTGIGRVALLRHALDAGTYDVSSEQIAEAIIRKVSGESLLYEDGSPTGEVGHEPRYEPPRHHPRLSVAASRPSQEELARAQLNRYAIDLRRSYQRELTRSRELEERSVAIVRALATAVAERDDDTGNHIQRVHDLGLLLARKVIPEDADDPQLAYGLILHDIGKIAIPDAVLRKRGPLNEEEWEVMRTHPKAGAKILAPLSFLSRARDLVLHHHERWDGRGYPYGLAGEEIPIWARVFAIVDAVDAMTSDRPYRRGRPLEAAIADVAGEAGAQFDPGCVEGFLSIDRREIAEMLRPAPENRLQILAA
jgi:HD-GYP domain-containing protein (c-di-GMP phosphodiesterase class II)